MYSSCGDFALARQVFDNIAQPDLPSWNSIINASVKVGLTDITRELFNIRTERNMITWSCMIDGCVKCREYKEALALFHDMQMLEAKNITPNEFTLSNMLSNYRRLGVIEHGE